MSSNWRWIAAALVLTLVAGGSLGVVADRVILRDDRARRGPSTAPEGTIWFDCSLASPLDRLDPEQRAAEHRAWRDGRLTDMRGDLDLDDEQVAGISAVFDSHRDLAHDYWDRTRAEYCSMREDLRHDVLELLRADQREGFEERLRRIDERARARLSAPGPAASDPK
ncbi:MAG TPA: hypothetical protein VNB06_07010 [Thermoanaerobaculia bacterium]|nr:hypothetical protein [Thermoanaerobaculia bacterium]